jgi:hypothetical protein
MLSGLSCSVRLYAAFSGSVLLRCFLWLGDILIPLLLISNLMQTIVVLGHLLSGFIHRMQRPSSSVLLQGVTSLFLGALPWAGGVLQSVQLLLHG